MKIDIVSVFPQYFDVLKLSLLGKAQENGLIELYAHDLRDWTHDVHRSVDDTPVGGGAGMVMKPEVWAQCLDELLGLPQPESFDDWQAGSVFDARTDEPAPSKQSSCSGVQVGGEGQTDRLEKSADGPILMFPNPSAPLFGQSDADELSRAAHLVFACGRYEGYDARIPDYYRGQGFDTREYSIGDYVLNGGEVAVAVILEAVTRLLPGFMGNPESIVDESYAGKEALLEYRQYTRPTFWRGMEVPTILTSGDHGRIDRFRRDEALERTSTIRPDLIERLDCDLLDKKDLTTLEALGWDTSTDHPSHLRKNSVNQS